jgi:hypothetical protein
MGFVVGGGGSRVCEIYTKGRKPTHYGHATASAAHERVQGKQKGAGGRGLARAADAAVAKRLVAK